MLWLTPPPYLRWAAAILLVVGAFAWDLHGRRTEPRPFAAETIPAGAPIGAESVTWRDVPVGLLPEVGLDAAVAAVDVASGSPLIPAVLRPPITVPDGWWAVPVPLAPGVGAGEEVLLLLLDPPGAVEGVVIEPADDAGGVEPTGLVAVPAERAGDVAAAAAYSALVVAVRPAGSG